MKIQGEHRFDADREALWEALLDPDVLSKTLPGAEELERVAENTFEGALKIRVGPVQGRFQGRVELSNLDPPAGYHLKMSGKGAPGFVDGEGDLVLEEHEGGTRLVYDIDAKVGGRIAGVGQRLLDSSAKVLARQAIEGLERQLAARSPQAAEGASAEASGRSAVAPSAEPPSQTAFALSMLRGVAADLVPPERRPLVVLVSLVLYTTLVVALTRACSG